MLKQISLHELFQWNPTILNPAYEGLQFLLPDKKRLLMSTTPDRFESLNWAVGGLLLNFRGLQPGQDTSLASPAGC